MALMRREPPGHLGERGGLHRDHHDILYSELGGVAGGLQALDERRGTGHPVRPPRRFRCVRVTWSDLTSSGGVRYPQASAPSWR